MAVTPSAMVQLGTPLPDFTLPDTEGALVSSKDLRHKPVLVAFLCNHCPYVKHVADRWSAVATRIQEEGVAVLGINSNDADKYPEDDVEHMRAEKRERGYTFPYLFDETQDVARAFQATCTPDFFLFDAEHRLVYRGQFDASRPGNDVPVTGENLIAAVEAMLAGREMPEQLPSMGCNIKWK